MNWTLLPVAVGCAALASTAGPALLAQDIRWAPSPQITTGKLPIGADSADLIMVMNGAEQRVGTARWSVERTTYQGRDVVRLSVGSGTGYLSLVDAVTHAPISSTLHSAVDSFHVDFAGARVTGRVTTSRQPSRAIDTTLSATPFLAVVIEHLLGVFPLREGLSSTLDLYSPGSGVTPTALRVVGTEDLEFRGQRRSTWKVVLSEQASGARVRVFWLDKATGRMLRREHTAPNGATVVQVTR